MYSSKKYFGKAITQYISKPLKDYGFRKYNTNNVVRLTEGGVLQAINFDKSRWGNGMFYVAVSNTPIKFYNSRFFPVGGERLGGFSSFIFPFSFEIRIKAQLCFEELQSEILRIILPWFDSTGDVNSLLEMHDLMSDIKNTDSGIYIHNAIFDRDDLAYLYMANKEWDKALSQLESIDDYIYDRELEKRIRQKSTDFDHIIKIIKDGDFEAIENTQNLNKERLWNELKLTKFKPYKITNSNARNDFIEKFNNRVERHSYYGDFSSYKYWFTFETLKQFKELYVTLDGFSESISGKLQKVSDRHFYIKINEYKFHFYFNSNDWVKEESLNYLECFSYDESLIEYFHINARVDFWGEYDGDMEYFNTHLFILDEINKIKDIKQFDTFECKFVN
ncbi:hypothetical protein [Marinicellulosiphila megalodicopiae]|uniref:hypothetical protein n=1 Tax=Marinicellulosiphila megalodicopiae TaxID=2724896 RepID=UPI003BAF7787